MGLDSWLVGLAARLLPADRGQWGEAMRAELQHVEGDRLGWAAGCAVAAGRIRAERETPYAVAALLSLVGLVWLDWAGSDPPAYAVLFTAPLVLGYLAPARARLTGALIGACPLVTHGLADLTGMFLPSYQYAPLRIDEWLLLAAVAGPAVLLSSGRRPIARGGPEGGARLIVSASPPPPCRWGPWRSGRAGGPSGRRGCR